VHAEKDAFHSSANRNIRRATRLSHEFNIEGLIALDDLHDWNLRRWRWGRLLFSTSDEKAGDAEGECELHQRAMRRKEVLKSRKGALAHAELLIGYGDRAAGISIVYNAAT
jgi:hypothetical protein